MCDPPYEIMIDGKIVDDKILKSFISHQLDLKEKEILKWLRKRGETVLAHDLLKFLNTEYKLKEKV